MQGAAVYDIMKQITLATRLHVTSHDKLTDAGYETAKERSIDRIGVQLKQVYTKVLEAAGKPVH